MRQNEDPYHRDATNPQSMHSAALNVAATLAAKIFCRFLHTR